MAFEKAKAHLSQFGLDDRIHFFDVSTATVELAAQAVGCEPARIAKTLSFELNEGCILIVCAGDVKIDNRKFKDTFHTKAKMLSHERAEELTGHKVGAFAPLVSILPPQRSVWMPRLSGLTSFILPPVRTIPQ